MKTKTKALALVLCAVLLVVSTVFVTMAYLTSQDSVTNTFTVGKVTITLDEAKVDEYGNVVANAERIEGNEYKLIPGHTYTKDPKIHVDTTSEDCYLFVEIVNGLGNDGTIIGLDAYGWEEVKGQNNVYCYCDENGAKKIVSKGTTVAVFDEFIFGEKAVPSNYKDKQIVVTAYAIQADALSEKTPAEIWDLFE